MAFNPLHCGLYFTPRHIQTAQKKRGREPFLSAWQYLQSRPQTGLIAAQRGGYRYLFEADENAAAAAVATLRESIGAGFNEDTTTFEGLTHMLIQAQTFEMLREFPGFEPGWQAQWLDFFWDRVSYFNQLPYDLSYVERLWLNLLNLVTGIVLEREPIFQQGVDFVEQVVERDIHPAGFIPAVVQGGDGGGLYRQLLAINALVLSAEAATHSGVDLWAFASRGVSVMTTALYPLYFYYRPNEWGWDAEHPITNEPFQNYGGFLEIINYRTQHRDLKQILADLRPIYDAPGGGLTTLSHGVAVRRGLFG